MVLMVVHAALLVDSGLTWSEEGWAVSFSSR